MPNPLWTRSKVKQKTCWGSKVSQRVMWVSLRCIRRRFAQSRGGLTCVASHVLTVWLFFRDPICCKRDSRKKMHACAGRHVSFLRHRRSEILTWLLIREIYFRLLRAGLRSKTKRACSMTRIIFCHTFHECVPARCHRLCTSRSFLQPFLSFLEFDRYFHARLWVLQAAIHE